MCEFKKRKPMSHAGGLFGHYSNDITVVCDLVSCCLCLQNCRCSPISLLILTLCSRTAHTNAARQDRQCVVKAAVTKLVWVIMREKKPFWRILFWGTNENPCWLAELHILDCKVFNNSLHQSINRSRQHFMWHVQDVSFTSAVHRRPLAVTEATWQRLLQHMNGYGE